MPYGDMKYALTEVIAFSILDHPATGTGTMNHTLSIFHFPLIFNTILSHVSGIMDDNSGIQIAFTVLVYVCTYVYVSKVSISEFTGNRKQYRSKDGQGLKER
jgi:hypothetical protein